MSRKSGSTTAWISLPLTYETDRRREACYAARCSAESKSERVIRDVDTTLKGKEIASNLSNGPFPLALSNSKIRQREPTHPPIQECEEHQGKTRPFHMSYLNSFSPPYETVTPNPSTYLMSTATPKTARHGSTRCLKPHGGYPRDTLRSSNTISLYLLIHGHLHVSVPALSATDALQTRLDRHTSTLTTTLDAPDIDSHLLHLWEARRGLTQWWRRQRHNRKLKLRIAQLTLEAATYDANLTGQNWHTLCDKLNVTHGTARTWSLLCHLIPPGQTKSDRTKCIYELLHATNLTDS
ncbi:hypothetical protein HPB47_001494 [Ixodes persulcatus]|uniref:Uncharacterized protein n=1 Tax=Ixodes persulcatus TaxID=34615 RepID=A0AC60PQ60_IXOPE|nr:hypothetical protein HPB47_001494 [Ixodes persulcatus]